MLLDIRKVTRGWIAGGLLTLLGVGFAFWGIQGSLRFAPSDAVASGHGVTIHAADFQKAFDNAVEQARQQSGASITRDEAAKQGLTDQVLNEMIGAQAINHIAEQAGFYASDSMVASAIRSQSSFRNQISGAFDRDAYHSVLQQNGITEAKFESDVRDDLARREFATTAIVGLHPPAALSKILYALDTERRVISVAVIPPNIVPPPAEPTEKDLRAFYDDHKVNFQTPELRDMTIVTARPATFAAKIEVPEDKIKQLYEYRKPTLAAAEKRSFVEISAPNQEVANAAAQQLAAGGDPDKIAAALHAQAVKFSEVIKQEVPDPAVANAVFALQKGQSSGAIQGKLAWSAARVTDVQPAGAAPSYESQHDALKAELAKQMSQDAMSEAVDKFDQERSNGKSLEEAAKDAGLEVTKAANVNVQGASDEGGPVAALVSAPELLKAAFEAPQGQPTDFAPTPDGGYGLVQVDAIKPAGVRPFDQVKNILAPAWKNSKVGDAMRAIAEGVSKDVSAGKSFADAVKAHNLPMIAASQEVTRGSAKSTPFPMLVQAVFGANDKDVVMAPDAKGQVLLVAQVEHTLREEPSRNPQLFAQAQQAVEKMAGDDVLLSLQNAALRAAAVKTNQKLINQTLGLGADDSSNPPS